jgi:SAM-dependent methyltransferase
MRRLVALGEADGWGAVMAALPAALRDYVDSPERVAWLPLLDSFRMGRVLDVGAGWGSLSAPIASFASRTIALERVAERVRMARIHCDSAAPGRVAFIQGDALTLPFRPETFDLILLNGVLEWVALWRAEGAPRAIQRDFLRRLGELCRPGGVILIGIENRFGLPFWQGARDHSGMRFTSLLPRRLADWLHRRPGSYGIRSTEAARGYRTWIYSLNELKKLVVDAGLVVRSAHVVHPSYNLPRHLLPTEPRSLKTALRILAGHGHLPGFFGRFAAPAARGAILFGSAFYLTVAASNKESEETSTSLARLAGGPDRPFSYLRLVAGRPVSVEQLGIGAAAVRLRHAADVARQVAERAAKWIPRILEEEDGGDWFRLRTEYGGGESLRTVAPAHARRLLATCGEFLDCLVTLPVAGPDEVFSHGDFSPSNLLVAGDGFKVIDWQDAGARHRAFDLATLAMTLLVERSDGIDLAEACLIDPLRRLLAGEDGAAQCARVAEELLRRGPALDRQAILAAAAEIGKRVGSG